MGLLPAAVAIIAMLIFIRYPLTDDKFRQIRDETEARKAAELEAELETNRSSALTSDGLPAPASPSEDYWMRIDQRRTGHDQKARCDRSRLAHRTATNRVRRPQVVGHYGR
jgi:Tfp pilus assembly protein FimT